MRWGWRFRPIPAAVVLVAWIGIVAAGVAMNVLDRETVAAGRSDLLPSGAANLVFIPAMLSLAGVGTALSLHRPEHPVAWLFLALALVVMISGAIDSYANYAAASPGALPEGNLVAVIGDRTFIPWLAILGLILLTIPTGKFEGPAARVTAVTIVVAAVVTLVTSLFSPYDGVIKTEPPVVNPLATDSSVVTFVRVATIVLLHAGLIVAAGMLIARFRRARGGARRQLRWMVLASVAFPLLIVAAFVAALLNQEDILAVLAGCFLSVIPIAAGLAVERDHLYDIDRLISRGLTYSFLTAFLIVCYVVVVVFVGESLSSVGGGTEIAVALATLATVSIAGPARKFLQTALDRRFNRREYDALASIQRFVRQPAATASVEEALQEAAGDRRLQVAYWIEDREQWVREDGSAADAGEEGFIVERRGSRTARVNYNESGVNRRVLEGVLAEAAAELENARLRAAITLQLREVKESRVRILAAQTEERHRIERNLHDGAQQRLLALALQLRAAEVSGDAGRQSVAIDAAIDELQVAVKELRDLANGLHPIALSDGGLASALSELAGRSPIKITLNVAPDRFPLAVEEAAWFAACEAAANAVKHAAASMVEIVAVREADSLMLSVADDGRGGANPAGRGLRGLADRAEAIGGRLDIISPLGGGTIVRMELPCAL